MIIYYFVGGRRGGKRGDNDRSREARPRLLAEGARGGVRGTPGRGTTRTRTHRSHPRQGQARTQTGQSTLRGFHKSNPGPVQRVKLHDSNRSFYSLHGPQD